MGPHRNAPARSRTEDGFRALWWTTSCTSTTGPAQEEDRDRAIPRIAVSARVAAREQRQLQLRGAYQKRCETLAAENKKLQAHVEELEGKLGTVATALDAMAAEQEHVVDAATKHESTMAVCTHANQQKGEAPKPSETLRRRPNCSTRGRRNRAGSSDWRASREDRSIHSPWPEARMPHAWSAEPSPLPGLAGLQGGAAGKTAGTLRWTGRAAGRGARAR